MIQTIRTRLDSSVVIPRLARWSIIGALAIYLSYETGRYRLLGVALPVLGAAVVVPLLVGALALYGRRIKRRAVLRVGTTAVAVAGSAVIGFLLLAWLLHWKLNVVGRTFSIALMHVQDQAINLRLFKGGVLLPLAVIVVALLVGAVIGTRLRARPGAIQILALISVTWFVMSDLVLFQSAGLRDLRLGLGAGAAFARGHEVYLSETLYVAPKDPTQLPFLYPPFTLPLFALLSALPFWLVAAGWLLGSAACALAALRLFGLSWEWALALLLWPAFAEGIYVGNVAAPAILLFALGPWIGASLVLSAVFKFQGGIPAFWLIRERRWRALATGVGAIGALAALTLPLTGTQRWIEWFRGLQLYAESQTLIPTLYGFALPGFLPYPVYLALAVLAIAIAFAARGRVSLARFGVAGVVGSPSLYTHGFLPALPAFLLLRSFWFWVTLALTATVLGPGWWIAIAIGVTSWFVPAMRRETAASEQLHPLQGVPQPWPMQRLPVPGWLRRGEPPVVARRPIS